MSEKPNLLEQLWSIIGPRLAIVVVGGLVSLFVSVVVWLWTIPSVKREIVRTLLIKIEEQLVYQEAKDAFKVAMENSLKDPFFPTEFDNQLRKSKAFDDRFAGKWKEQMKNVVAYSYNTSFAFNDSRKIYDLRYVKPEGNIGRAECTAIYPPRDSNDSTAKDVTNAIRLTLNNQEEPASVIVPFRDRIGKGTIKFDTKNEEQFAPGTKTDFHQRVTLQVDDVPAFSGTIWVDCTITIIGPLAHVG